MMKKTFLTFIAAGFSFSVAFAQTAPLQEKQQTTQAQIEQSAPTQGEQGKRQLEMSELPQQVQDAFQNGEYSDLKVLAIYEKAPNAKAAAMAKEQATIYEFELARVEENTAAGTTDESIAGLEKEKVSARQADVILQIDEKGEIIKEKDLDKEKKNQKDKQ